MGKSTKTYEERIQEKDLRIGKLAQELKRYEAQKKQLEKRRKEEERKIRTHRLIEIGAAVESVLGRCIEIEEIPKLIAFLNRQERWKIGSCFFCLPFRRKAHGRTHRSYP